MANSVSVSSSFYENVFVVRLSLILFWAMSLFDVALIITANYSFLSIDTC